MSRNSLMIFFVVATFLAANMWKVDCPTCNGEGHITNTAALQSLKILDINPEAKIPVTGWGEEEYEPIPEWVEPGEARENPIVKINETATMITFKAPLYEEQLCGEQIYTYEILLNVSLQNVDASSLLGGIEAIVMDSNTSWIIHREPVQVGIEGYSKRFVETDILFTSPKVLTYFDVLVKIPTGMDLTCPTCNAENKVSVIEWLLLKAGLLPSGWTV